MSPSSPAAERPEIVDATARDVAAAALALEAAFASDPLIAYFFHTHPQGVAAASRRFFTLLLRLRIALGMPALMLKEGERVVGVAMGYDTERPAWPEPFAGEWTRFEAETPGFAARLHAYEALASAHQPAAPHFYLGVLGVHPSAQGTGAGKALLLAFCRRSASDPLSSGVYLETSSAQSREFYLRNGFVERGADDLAGTPLWCLFRSDTAAARAEPGVTVRCATPADATAIAEGERATAAVPGRLVGRPGEIPAAAYAAKIAALQEGGRYLVAEEGGRVVGHAFLDPMPMSANAHVFQLNVVVHPGHGSRGLGRRLIEELFAWARNETRLHKVELLVRATNERAIRLYRRLGFVEEGRLRARVRLPDGRFVDDLAMAWFPDSSKRPGRRGSDE